MTNRNARLTVFETAKPPTVMNFRFSTALAALCCVCLASCYPYDESQNRRKPPTRNQAQKTITSPEQQKVQEQRERVKAEEESKKKEAPRETIPDTSEPGASTNPSETAPKPPAEEKRMDIPVAGKVPGKDGYVFSPFNNKLIDVRGIPTGTLVADPTYPESAKKHFRVP